MFYCYFQLYHFLVLDVYCHEMQFDAYYDTISGILIISLSCCGYFNSNNILLQIILVIIVSGSTA